ncbi:uncharacterized protein TRIADDRAFT_54536 [Trichoplax adhaerens]|uniref:G-protein coupled receptors family 1 profile domain-containing protein n=1 Tax=Trichoplax adhaerens TaxID=10228 RepID=B3RSB3_TRIAD|nr:hypothetical protein TRIADDRAFT_54536 [Trichoplax adhaerens]EDV27025.1 hypothetical protein TRIADDRAFT_54536 [Trichoplax adhaerens]|eukprot:XP_002111021.1 hypothetical protein TRIADDRAFT_54536 [Trichoplax adhaerens]
MVYITYISYILLQRSRLQIEIYSFTKVSDPHCCSNGVSFDEELKLKCECYKLISGNLQLVYFEKFLLKSTMISSASINATINSRTPPVKQPYTWDEEQYILLVVAILTIVNNAILLCVILFHRNLWKATNVIIISMSTAAILWASLYLIPRFVRKDVRFNNSIFCTLLPQFYVLFDVAVCLHLCLISYEKYYAILFPFRYIEDITIRSSVIAISISWLIALIAAAAPFWSHRYFLKGLCVVRNIFKEESELAYYLVIYCVVFFLPLVSMLIVYGHIFIIANRHIRKFNIGRQNVSKRTLVRNVRAARYMAVVVCAFTVMCLPYHIFFFVHFFRIPLDLTDHMKGLRYLSFSYMFINPVMYGYLNPEIRKTFVKHVCKESFQFQRSVRSKKQVSPTSRSPPISSFTTVRNGTSLN